MKRICLLILTMTVSFGLSGLSWADVDVNSSWSEIRSEKGVIVMPPKIEFGDTRYSIFNVCVYGDYFRTSQPVAKCQESASMKCVSSYALTPRVYSWGECVAWEGRDRDNCLRYESRNGVRPVTYKVPVHRRSPTPVEGDKGGIDRYVGPRLFTKVYRIPSC